VHELEAKVQPFANFFAQAEFRARALDVPASMQKAHDEYIEALILYTNAATETLKVSRDGDDRHLIDAQGMSERAAKILNNVGDVLWPGEYRPN
jgi:hypothetical protein